MYTPKPKDMTKFLVGITSAQALHTWEYADKNRLNQIGSSAILSSAARKKREANRKTIGEYRSSALASMPTKMRRDVTEFSQNERQKIITRREQAGPAKAAKAESSVPPERPLKPDASLYRRPLV